MEVEVKEIINNARIKYDSRLYSQNLVFKGNFLSVYRNNYEINHNIIEREIGTKKLDKAVVIIPVTYDNKIVMVAQPRVAIPEHVDVELPAGYVEDNEEAIDTAKRELLEETGYVGKEYILLDGYYSAEGASSEYMYIVLAKCCVQKDRQHLDKDEFIDFFEVPLEDALKLIDDKYILGASTRIGLFNYLKYLEKNNFVVKEYD